jgi:3-hydroxyisobutyrate dehydrogenase-like beta-hydroxyacid dehydrogenase
MPDVKRVAILSPGDMGGAIGQVLHANGIDVLSCLAGRSELTRERAAEAGFRDVPDVDTLVRESDVILSVLVPSQATPVAEAVAAAMRRTGAHPAFAECNAIAPNTVLAVEHTIRAAGGPFVDAGIIGGPPRAGYSPHIYCSGPDTAYLEALNGRGVDFRVVGTKVGQASGLKMVYAASTKGFTALWTELLTAARALGLQDALFAEFGPDHAPLRQARNGIPSMPRRARRWVGEMEEIAGTFEALGLTPHIFEGAADMYRFIGDTPLADQTSRDPDPNLDQVLETLVSRLTE